MIIINLATIDFGGGGGSSKPLITEPLIANVWSREKRVFAPANYNVDAFSDVTINTAVIGENSALYFGLIGWDGNESDDVNAIYNADIEYSKSVLDKWNNEEISTFSNDTKLVYCPFVDTSNITDMYGMFMGCSKLQFIPLLDCGKVTDMNGMFTYCSSLTTIPQLNTSNVTNMFMLFMGCSKLQFIPLLDCNKVTNIDTFFGYSNITTLTELGGFKDLKIDWNDNYGLNKCPNLTYQSIMNVLNNLYDFRANGDMSTTKTIKINSNTYNLLTADDIAMANNKGWNITK